MTSFDGGQGWLSAPASGQGPAVILIQEWWGLVGHIRDVADRLAGEGFLVLAPDFYEGKSTAEPDEAGSLMMALNIDKAGALIRSSLDFLMSHPLAAPTKAGVCGFCMGGQLALYAACLDDRIGAAVNFYGIHPNVQPDLANLNAPLLGLFAEHDDYASPAAVAALSDQLKAQGKAHDFHTYPGAQHAFFNSDRPEVFSPDAAEDAWDRTLAHLKTYLV